MFKTSNQARRPVSDHPFPRQNPKDQSNHNFQNRTESIAEAVIVSYVEPGIYHIAACLTRLRPLIFRIESYPSLLGRHHGSVDVSPAPTPEDQESRSERRRLTPRIDVKLTGQGNLDTLIAHSKDEHIMMESL